MSIKAKFYVASVEHFAGGGSRIRMQVVSRGAENKEWASATPSGQLEISLSTKATAQFVLGKEYYLTFDLAEPAPVPGDGHAPEPYDMGYGSTCCAKCGVYRGKVDGDDDGWASHREHYGA